MNSKKLKSQLKRKIDEALNPLLTTRKVAIMDAPYHDNIGDILILEGEKAYLKMRGIEVVNICSYHTCHFPDLDADTTILFHGGGNIGDMYHEHMDFLLKLIDKYSHNRIIVLSQTIFYSNKELQNRDLTALKNHSDLYLFARDLVCYNEVVTILGDKALLVPDMAFYIPSELFAPFVSPQVKSKLYIDRVDCEKVRTANIDIGADVYDWPVFHHTYYRPTFINRSFSLVSRQKLPLIGGVVNRIWDYYYRHSNFCLNMVKIGVRFISPYKEIKTTRLHGCILAILLEMEHVTLLNNSYGKNKNFYDTWLQDLNSVKFI